MAPYRLAVLGDPVEHSRSPGIHRAMLSMAGLQGEYLKVRAGHNTLARTLEELRRGEWDGLNVTMPLKSAAAELADSLSPRARRCGSVNTLWSAGSLIHGESTDALAFDQLFTSHRFREMSTVYVLGAGGAAAAALAAVPEYHHLYVAARRPEAASDLTQRLRGEVVSWGTAVAGALVVNTTPLGMAGEVLPEGILDLAVGLIDLPYGSVTTTAVEAAKTAGIPHSDGEEFLIRQAIGSFSLWTGVAVDYDALVATLRNA